LSSPGPEGHDVLPSLGVNCLPSVLHL